MAVYKITSGFSSAGVDLRIPIAWEFDNIADLFVVISDAQGNATVCDYWSWDSNDKVVVVPNSTIGVSAFVSRKEDAENLFQALESKEVNVQNIIEQFKKNKSNSGTDSRNLQGFPALSRLH